MNQELKKNQPATVALIINMAMLMSTAMFFGITFLLPATGGSEGAGTEPGSAPALFYAGLGMALAGLAVGHTSRSEGSAGLKKHIVALALIEACALFGVVLYMTQGDAERARSMIILGIVGIGSLLLLNIKKFK